MRRMDDEKLTAFRVQIYNGLRNHSIEYTRRLLGQLVCAFYYGWHRGTTNHSRSVVSSLKNIRGVSTEIRANVECFFIN